MNSYLGDKLPVETNHEVLRHLEFERLGNLMAGINSIVFGIFVMKADKEKYDELQNFIHFMCRFNQGNISWFRLRALDGIQTAKE